MTKGFIDSGIESAQETSATRMQNRIFDYHINEVKEAKYFKGSAVICWAFFVSDAVC